MHRTELPEGAATPLVKDDFGNVYGMFYALTGDGLQDRELSDYAELIKREVSELDGVERVDLYGKREECINISLLQGPDGRIWRETCRSSRYLERTEVKPLIPDTTIMAIIVFG